MASQYLSSDTQVIAANLREARSAARLTQAELGRILEVDGMYISKWERGVVKPTKANMRRIAEALGRDVEWFFAEHTPRGDAAA